MEDVTARTTMLILWCSVECVRRNTAAVVGSQYGYSSGLLFHCGKRYPHRDLYARSCGTGKEKHPIRSFLY